PLAWLSICREAGADAPGARGTRPQRTIGFYCRPVRLHVVHDRHDGDLRVVWLSERTKEPGFVLVLFEVHHDPPPAPSPPPPPPPPVHPPPPRLPRPPAGRGRRRRRGRTAGRHPRRPAGVCRSGRGVLLHRQRSRREPGRVLVRAADRSPAHRRVSRAALSSS